MENVLRLVPIYCGAEARMLDPLGTLLGHVFAMRTEQHPPRFDPEIAYDASRGQYNSRALLRQLLTEAPTPGDRVLGVTTLDLFIPVLTYVFGEAQLGGPVAIVSLHRLNTTMYGLPPNDALLYDRLVKEAVHELGHTFHLLHCRDQLCVMASSTYVEGIDLKTAQFCERCRAALRS